MQTISTVEHLLKTKDGDIGGMILGDGTIVDTPLGHGETLKAMIKRGDRVRIDGKKLRSRRGPIHIAARKIVMPAKRESDDSKNDIRQSVARPSKGMEVVEGVVTKITINRNGDVNGFRLNDGLAIKTPVREGEKILAHIHTGDNVQVGGKRVMTRQGTFKLAAHRIHINRPVTEKKRRSRSRIQTETLLSRVNRTIALLTVSNEIVAELHKIKQDLENRINKKLKV
jgi:hypothetical protein